MMTATPIPRTLAITAFGDMDVSIIDQMPAGRKSIVTRWIKHEQLPQVLTWLEGKFKRFPSLCHLSFDWRIRSSRFEKMPLPYQRSWRLILHARQRWLFYMVGWRVTKRPDHAGFQGEKDGYSGFDDGYWGWGQRSQCDCHDYHGCRSLRSQSTSPA